MIAFVVNVVGEKTEKAIVFQTIIQNCCFRRLRDPSRPANIRYFYNPKSWMTSDVMLAVLKRFDRKLLFDKKKVFLILDNANGVNGRFVFTNKNHLSTYDLRTQPQETSHLMQLLLKTPRSSIGKAWLSIYSQESMQTLLQHESLRMQTY